MVLANRLIETIVVFEFGAPVSAPMSREWLIETIVVFEFFFTF